MDSITFDKYGTTFEVGKIYENALGTYEVKKIEDGKLFVKYLSVKNATVNLYAEYKYDAEGQAQSLYKMRQEHIRPSFKKFHKKLQSTPKISDKEVFTVGYLASHGYIQIDVGPNSLDTFPGDFKAVTKLDADDFKGKGYHPNPKMNKYAYSMSIRFPDPGVKVMGQLDIPKGYILRDSHIEINSNEYVWHLLNAGFLPGRNNDNPRITVRLDNDKLEEFFKGFDHEKA